MKPADRKLAQILVVDDEPHSRELMARALAREGYVVDGAANAEEAWYILHDKAYDCILLDLRMPGMGGVELYREILDFRPELAAKIIVTTGDTASAAINEFLANVPNLVLPKPLDLGELRQRVLAMVA